MAGKNFFKRNVGMLDRMFRFCAAIFLIILGSLFLEGTAGIVVAVLGAFMLVTAFTGYCPGYVPLGISTIGSPGARSAGMSKMMSRCCSDAGEVAERCGSMWRQRETGDEEPTEVRNT